MWAPVKHAVDRRAVTEHQDVMVTVFYPFVPVDGNVIDFCDAFKIPLNDAHRVRIHLVTKALRHSHQKHHSSGPIGLLRGAFLSASA